MKLPPSRGPVSTALIEALRAAPHDLDSGISGEFRAMYPDSAPDPLVDEDLQLTLFMCYELHYRGWDGIDEDWEWQPSLLALRAVAERRFEARLRALVDPALRAVADPALADPALAAPAPVAPADLPAALSALVAADDGPSLAKYLRRHASAERFREFVTHRSIYHLKEADPHSWAIPRLDGRAKAALIEIQLDEYGGGQLSRMHSELFRTTMSCLGLDPTYGAYLDSVPAITLATNNLISLFGLHRRLRGALLGHLAAFEMTSSLPNRQYGDGLRRLGGSATATRFYDEHVVADAVHEQIAAHDLCGGFAAAEPDGTGEVLFGAACALALDRLFATHLLTSWQAGQGSLRGATSAQGAPRGATSAQEVLR